MIRLTQPFYDRSELDAVETVLVDGWLSPGTRYVRTFEYDWAAYVGVYECAAVSSGTLALIGALAALRQFEPGDVVIVPTFTCAPTLAAVVNAGARPVLVDCDAETLNMSPACLEIALERWGEHVLCVLPVSVYGMPLDPLLYAIASHYDRPVIEDACEAHGAESEIGLKVGASGRAGCFSFRGDKMISTLGTGGAVVSDDAYLIDAVRRARDLYLGAGVKRYVDAERPGWGSQMSSPAAAFGSVQIGRLDEIVARRREQAETYRAELLPLATAWHPGHAWWRFCVWVREPVVTARKMEESGVETVPAFTPLHRQTIRRWAVDVIDGGNAEWAARHGLCIPIGDHVGDQDQAKIVRLLQGEM